MTPSRPAALALALRSALDPTITPDQWLLAFELLDEVLAKGQREEDISTRAAQGRLLRWLSKALGPWAEFYPQADLQALIDDMVRGTSTGNSPTLDLRLLALLNPSTYFGLIDHHGWRGELNSEVSTSSLWTVLLRHSVAGSTAFSENPSGIISSSAFVEFERFSMEMTRRASVSCSTDDPAYERQLDTGYIRLDPERIAWLAEQHGPSGWFAESLVASDRIEQSPDLLNESFVRVFQGSDIDLLARLADVVKNDWREALRLIPDEYGKFAPALDGVPSHDPAQGQILNELAVYKRLARSRASGNRYDMIQAARAAAAEVHLLALQVLAQDQLEAMARTLPLMRTYAELLSGPYDSLYQRLLLAPPRRLLPLPPPHPLIHRPPPPAMPRLTTAKYWSPKIPPLLRKVMDPMMTQAEWRQAFDEFDQGIGWDLTDACEDLSTPVLQGRFLRRFYQAIGPLRDYYAPRDLQAMINDLMRAKREQTASWMDLLLLAFLNPSFDTSVLDDEDFTKQLVRRDDLQMHDVWTVVLRHSVVGPVLFAESPDNVISDTLEHERTRFDNEMALRFDVQHVLSYYRPGTREEIQIGRIRPEPGRQAQLAAVEKSVESVESTEFFEFIETFESLDRVMGDPRMVDKAFISAFEHSDIPLLAMFADVLKNDVQKLYALKLEDHEVGSLLPMDGNSKNNAHQEILAINLLDYFAEIERQHLAGAMQSLSNIALAIEDITFVTTEKSWLAIVVERLRFVNAYIALTGSAPYESLYDRVL